MKEGYESESSLASFAQGTAQLGSLRSAVQLRVVLVQWTMETAFRDWDSAAVDAYFLIRVK